MSTSVDTVSLCARACINASVPIENSVINHGTVCNVADPTIIRSYGQTPSESRHRSACVDLFIPIAETQISDLMDRLTFDTRLEMFVRLSEAQLQIMRTNLRNNRECIYGDFYLVLNYITVNAKRVYVNVMFRSFALRSRCENDDACHVNPCAHVVVDRCLVTRA